MQLYLGLDGGMACRQRRSSLLLRSICGAGLACLLPAVWDSAATAFGLASRGTKPVEWLARSSRLAARPRQRTALLALEGLDAVQGAAVLTDATAAACPPLAGFGDSLLLAFADQGQNINGILFQASLPAYILFLYFLGYKGNNTPPLVQFGFSFLLLFVFATIPTGIISKSTYGVILADSDWLHGTAESLLTCTNILLVLGFRGALAGDAALADSLPARVVSGVWLAAVVATLASGIPVFGWETHTPFLAGLGALPPESLPTVEPVNALSIPNWMVHFSTVFEFIIAMTLAWRYAEATGNEKWKGLAWGMLPSHCSSVAALTFHIFYNQVPWILTAQAAFTFLGNATLAVAALRIAVSNGWTISELNPVPAFSAAFSRLTDGEAPSPEEETRGGFDVARLRLGPTATAELTPGPVLAAEVVLLTVLAAYLTKYGELALAPSLFQSSGDAASTAATFIIATPPLLVLSALVSSSPDIRQGSLPPLALGDAMGSVQGLSFQDVKKYGAAGTVAYILTEFAFWAVAFPFAAWSLYSTTGHWPDVLTSSEDRVAVAGFVFAGANIARLALPLRLAAAIAFVPWVDSNITSRFVSDGEGAGRT